jgi:hypothetical protein
VVIVKWLASGLMALEIAACRFYSICYLGNQELTVINAVTTLDLCVIPIYQRRGKRGYGLLLSVSSYVFTVLLSKVGFEHCVF